MRNHRKFGVPRVVAFALGALLCARGAPAAPTVNQTGSSITVDNGLLSFRVNKSGGRVDSIVLGRNC